ncbi:MAG: hypothetical protein PHX34_02020 [Candidatus Shapirobacteria bacterium]|nr:hypothetical protein [Candidatus Shapirobacteria bacterium]
MKKIKKVKKLGIVKFLVIALVLGGGLVYGTQIVQKNQENRSQAGVAGSVVRGACKTICKAKSWVESSDSGGCDSFCNKLVFSCGTLKSVDDVRGSVCYTECKVASFLPDNLTDSDIEGKCKDLCNLVMDTTANLLSCNDDKCAALDGECSAPISSANGVSCTLSNGKSGKVVADKCLSRESYDKRCCVPSNTTSTSDCFKTTGRPNNCSCTKNSQCSSGYCGVAGSIPGVNICKTATKINGACGSSKNTCTKGTLNDTTDSSTYYKWQCVGSNGGTTASCTKKKMVNGVCGKSDRQNVTKKPTSGLCSSGTSTIVYYKSSSKYWYWSCKGSNGGTTASCKAYNRGGSGGQM